MMGFHKNSVIVSSAIVLFVMSVVASRNIESNGDGSYCINKISKRGVPANCTSDSFCEDLLEIPTTTLNNIKCGSQGECITKQIPQNEYCKEACDKSPCGKYCLQEYETKTAMYCIETRDHPNAMPNQTAVSPNKYYCTCVLEQFIIFRRYLY